MSKREAYVSPMEAPDVPALVKDRVAYLDGQRTFWNYLVRGFVGLPTVDNRPFADGWNTERRIATLASECRAWSRGKVPERISLERR